MISIFKLVVRLLNKVNAARQHSAALSELRAANPSCTIMNASLHKASIGKHVAIFDRVYLDRVGIDDFSYVANDSRLVNVAIGSFCSIGPSVQIGLARHPSRIFVSTYPAFYSDQNTGCPLSFRKDKIFDDSVPKTTIGSDVWVGSNVIIPGGIKIGTGAIVAAGTVVTKDVPPYAVVGGNPAKVVRYRFSDEQIKVLLASEWWNWPIDKIIRNVDNFSDLDKFKAIGN